MKYHRNSDYYGGEFYVEAVPAFLESAYPGFADCVDWALYPMCWKLEGVA